MTRYWFISSKYRRNSKLAILAIVLAFIVILLGAYTRLTDAGLSCPDWPNCYGYLTVPHTADQLRDAALKYPLTPINIKKAWTEMTHRYIAGIEGLLILFLAGSLLATHQRTHWKSTIIGISLIALLGVQVLLGMLTVTASLKPVIVLAHLLIGLSLISILWWSYLDLYLRDDFFIKRHHSHLIPWLWGALSIIGLQIILGGWVSTHYAGLACIDFPYCNGQWLPQIQWHNLNHDLISIHMLHRMGAVITGLYISVLAFSLMLTRSFRAIALLMLALIILQITLGVLNIIWLRPLSIALIHHALAILLLLTVITALTKAYFESQEKRYGHFFA